MKHFALIIATVLVIATVASAQETPYVVVDGQRIYTNSSEALFAYVNAPDRHFSYFDTGARLQGDGWTGYIMNMTSQQWLSHNETNRSVWTHHLVIVRPDEIKNKTHSFLYITGGSNKQSPPKADDVELKVLAAVAANTGTVGAALFQVPNQPTEFYGDPLHKDRSEDGLVAYTWKHVADYPVRPDWSAYFPMTKASIRALDVISDFSRKEGFASPDKFFILGASKRGATTWLVGAYDGWLPPSKRRISGIAPIVFDMLNLPASVPHMFQAYGGWTFAFGDYYANNITSLINTPKMHTLAEIVDPFSYRKYLTMPKLVISATGDEFFMPDDMSFWWDKMPGEKHILMIHNAEHSMITGLGQLIDGASAFYASLIASTSRPSHDWSIDAETGALTMWTSEQPSKVFFHSAETVPSSPNRRDFRMIKGNTPAAPCQSPAFVVGDVCVNPIVWESTEVQPDRVENGVYYYKIAPQVPASGNWLGFFFEMQSPAPSEQTFKMTTEVSIIPNVFPFPSCGSGDACHGNLV